MENISKQQELIGRGVKILNPESVFIGHEVDIKRISSDNVTIYPGTRIYGTKTLICGNAELGFEAPVTIDNCYVGPGTLLKGGFFQGACFAGSNSFGSCAHVRAGTILEEQAGAAHCVGLKQTILFPFVTLGSLINFCDCFMAGGTDRKNHSEVGSSFIHFNYTPNQDKATPSMMGNVFQGVFLNQNPIFLGGQGGLVGPCKIGFGCLTAAGSVIRKDEVRNDRLLLGGALRETSIVRSSDNYSNILKIYNNNVSYISSLISLLNWYREIRICFVVDFYSRELHKGMVETLEIAIDERIKRLKEFVLKIEHSKSFKYSDHLKNFSGIKEFLKDQKKADFKGSKPDIKVDEKNYIDFIRTIDPSAAAQLGRWLYSIEYKIFEKAKLQV